MHGIGLFLFAVAIFSLGVFFLVRAEDIVYFMIGNSDLIPENLVPVMIAITQIMGFFSLFFVLTLVCAIWANS